MGMKAAIKDTMTSALRLGTAATKYRGEFNLAIAKLADANYTYDQAGK